MVGMTRRVLAMAAAAFAVAEANEQIPFGLAPFLGKAAEQGVEALEAQMKPLFEALPKRAAGAGLDAESAKYALQRHLLEARGWRVAALAPGGAHGGQAAAKGYNGLPATSAPGILAEIFKKALSGKDFGLRELATLAAAVEKLVRMDSAELLTTALAVHGISEQDLDEKTQDLVIQTFMLFYLLPDTDYSKQTSESIKKYLDLAERVYPGWTLTMQWIQDLKQTKKTEGSSLQGFVDEIVFGYRHVFGNQCGSLRNFLLKHEQPGTGRVLLSKLRSISPGAHIPNSIWQFTESDDELRGMGALDESDPSRPAIIVTNYMTADANCLPSSQIVSTCCMNECDELLAGIEEHFESHAVSPEQLSDWTRALSANVSEAATAQLADIAYWHGGSVPIYGMAFAQWLHSVFPSQCPDPQDTRSWAAKAASALEAWYPGARWALRSLALLVAVASGVAGLAKSARPQKGDKDKKVN